MDDAATALADSFPPATREAWLKLVDAGLKGASFAKLVTKTADGLELQPLYTADDAPAGARLFAPGDLDRPWQVRTIVDASDPAEANRQALQDLQNGAASVVLRYAGPGHRGLGAGADLAAVLDGVLTDLAPIALDAGFDGPAAAEALSVAAGRGPAAPLVLHLDPLSAYARGGPGPRPLAEHVAQAAQTAVRLAEPHPAASLFLASGVAVHEAGGTEAQELGFAAAAALAYARAAEAAGLDPAEALARTVVGLATDGRYFMSLAKLRAMHAIWARITAAAGGPSPARPSPARIEARGSERMLSAVDPWVNLIRGTAAVFAAATGGAEAMVLQPFTEPLGAPTDFARRQARNMQLVLMEEAHLGRIADPAAGSWYVESLADRLARAGWAAMQAIEARGGAVVALESGWLAGEVKIARGALEKDVATRKTGLIGVSEFPNLAEAPVEVAAAPAALAMDGLLAPMRLSEPFERLRACADLPKAWLAQLGGPVEAAARTGFARNLLAAGGIAAEAGEPDAYAGDAPLAVICGSDERYAESAADAARALKAGGARAVWLAGKPGEHEAAWREAGIDGFLFAGMDAVATLTELQNACHPSRTPALSRGESRDPGESAAPVAPGSRVGSAARDDMKGGNG